MICSIKAWFSIGDSSGRDEDKDEKLLKQAIALSLEGAEEKDNEEDNYNERDDGEDDDEELMLRKAIALSFEEAEEEDD